MTSRRPGWVVVFTDALDNGAAKLITRRFDTEPEDRELQELMLRYGATRVSVRPPTA